MISNEVEVETMNQVDDDQVDDDQVDHDQLDDNPGSIDIGKVQKYNLYSCLQFFIQI